MNDAVFFSSRGLCRWSGYLNGTDGLNVRFQNNSGVEGSLKNICLEKYLPRRVKRRRHYTIVEAEKFLSPSSSTPAVSKC